MNDSKRPVLDYEPLKARGVKRTTVLALVGAAIVVGGVVYRLSPNRRARISGLPGGMMAPPTTMPWKAIGPTTAPATAPTPAPPITIRGDVALVPDDMPWHPERPEQTDGD